MKKEYLKILVKIIIFDYQTVTLSNLNTNPVIEFKQKAGSCEANSSCLFSIDLWRISFEYRMMHDLWGPLYPSLQIKIPFTSNTLKERGKGRVKSREE